MPSLYEQLGGKDAIHTIITQFYDKLFDDVMVGFLFKKAPKDRLISQQTAFLCKAFGGPDDYIGKSPGSAHTHLPILPGHFDRRIQILEQTLTEAGIDDKPKAKWIQIENSFRSKILKGSHDRTK